MQVYPPWVEPGLSGKNFTIPEVDNLPDLHGDIVDPQLVVFFNGNQFMVVPDLLAAFQERHPQYERIFVETLPPGVLVEQIEQGALVIGNLRFALAPDVYTAGKGRIEQLQSEKGWFTRSAVYARNTLAIMTRTGNTGQVDGLADLGRDGVRVSMPNPEIEGIGKLIVKAYEKAGGQELVKRVMVEKTSTGSTFLTQIHHRQTPMRVLRGESDAGPVWRTEVLFQQRVGNPIALVEIPEAYNQTGIYMAAQMKSAPHPRAAADFVEFLVSEAGQAVYREYGFLPPA